VAGALRGMGIVAAGLVGSTALRLAPTLRKSRMGLPVCGALVLATVALVGVLRWPMAGALPLLGLPAIAWAWWALGRPAPTPTSPTAPTSADRSAP
jgi:chromate transporter